MLTKVYLEGAMGERFGREWELSIETPSEAVALIDANAPGLKNWIRGHSRKYTHYQVIVEFDTGETTKLSETEYVKCGKMKSVRFVPIIEGSGKYTGVIIAAIMIVVGLYNGNSTLVQRGVVMMVTSAVSLLVAQIGNSRLSAGTGGSGANMLVSDAFDGPVNTTHQGVPVQLIYGRCLVGSHVISASVSIEQVDIVPSAEALAAEAAAAAEAAQRPFQWQPQVEEVYYDTGN